VATRAAVVRRLRQQLLQQRLRVRPRGRAAVRAACAPSTSARKVASSISSAAGSSPSMSRASSSRLARSSSCTSRAFAPEGSLAAAAARRSSATPSSLVAQMRKQPAQIEQAVLVLLEPARPVAQQFFGERIVRRTRTTSTRPAGGLALRSGAARCARRKRACALTKSPRAAASAPRLCRHWHRPGASESARSKRLRRFRVARQLTQGEAEIVPVRRSVRLQRGQARIGGGRAQGRGSEKLGDAEQAQQLRMIGLRLQQFLARALGRGGVAVAQQGGHRGDRIEGGQRIATDENIAVWGRHGVRDAPRHHSVANRAAFAARFV
jgi:hypothetical protein